MKLSLRFTNSGLISVVGLIVALLVLMDINAHRAANPTLTAAPANTVDRVVTKEFCLVDDSGKTRARIAMSDYDAPALQLFDRQGQQRAILRLNRDDVPSLRLFDANGKVRSVTGFNLNTMEPSLVFFDPDGRGALASSSEYGASGMGLTFCDEDLLYNDGTSPRYIQVDTMPLPLR